MEFPEVNDRPGDIINVSVPPAVTGSDVQGLVVFDLNKFPDFPVGPI
jgi:hypothetical protein